MQITCKTSGAYVQHVVCQVVQKDSPVFEFDGVEITFVLALFHWLKPFADEEGEETGVPGEKPDD